MINVDKPLTLKSRDGAFATVLDAGETALLGVVRISTSKVVFGTPYRGFTITRSGSGISGLVIAPGVTEVRVRGNLARDNGLDGFLIFGNGHTLSDNVAIHNGQDGFGVFGSEHILRDNLAISHGLSGYFVSGSENRLRGNLAIDNDHDGFIFEGSKHVLRGNAALGNKRSSIKILGDASVIISENNIYGNNSVEVNRQLNCGLVNGSGGLITATNNFWGAVTGPGPDPADEVCDFGRSNTVFSPFATREFRVPVKSFTIQGQPLTSDIENQD
jgi:parallel beta-helix repeat protein